MSSRTRIHDGSSGAAHPAATTALLLAGYYVIGLAANFCFKEGGTDAAHRLAYFIGGNAFGIISASGYNVAGDSLAQQEQVAGQIYAQSGGQAWAADGCPGT